MLDRLFLIFLFVPAVAAANPIQQMLLCGPDSKMLEPHRAGEYLSRAQSRYSELKAFRAKFSQRAYLVALDVEESSSGTVLFSAPGKMRWEYMLPEAQTFLLKDKTLWYYQPEFEQLMIDKLEKVLISELPVGFLMGIGDLTRDFKIEKGCLVEQGVSLELTPRKVETQGDLQRFILLVNPVSAELSGARIVDRAGNTTVIIFDRLEPIQSVTPQMFAENFPDDIDVDDRRTS